MKMLAGADPHHAANHGPGTVPETRDGRDERREEIKLRQEYLELVIR